MKTLQVRIPEFIHGQVVKYAQEEGVSMNNFILTLISNEVIRQETSDFFQRASSHFDPASFAEALSAVPDIPATRDDQINIG